MSPPRLPRTSIDEAASLTFEDHVSVDSGEPGNLPFFAKQQQLVLPSHTSSVTWKSSSVKEKEEFERVKQRVRHFAPEQFRAIAKPGSGPSEIFPQNSAEWVKHRRDILGMAEAQKQKNCELLKAQIAAQEKLPKNKRKIVSVFGKDAKVFKDGLSPVLGLPTIWSAEYAATIANWPTAAELQWNGDSRECRLAKTKCGRYLPPPRASSDSSAPFEERPFLRQLPLDQTGPIFMTGPRPDEIQVNNADMNEDMAYEELGNFYLGIELMRELGEWRPAFIPDWQQARYELDDEPSLQYECMVDDMGPGFGYADGPSMPGEVWFDETVVGPAWGVYETWA